MRSDAVALGVWCLLGWATIGPVTQSHAQNSGERTAGHTVNAVAVEPFETIGLKPSLTWIGIGIAAALTIDLGGITVSAPDLPHWLVRGTVERIDGYLHISASLIDEATDRSVHTVTLNGSDASLFRLQDQLARELTMVIATGTPTPMGTRRPNTPSTSTSPSSSVASLVPSNTPARLISGSTPVIDGPPPPLVPEVVSRDTQGRMTIRAIALESPLDFDGSLDEQVYHDVPSITDFIQQEPQEGALATDQTEVWVLFDTETLYISARCWSEQPNRIVANEMRRDAPGFYGNETLAVVLDPFYDRRNGYQFMTNALGGLFDSTIANERTPNLDWNGIWDVRTNRFEQGWTVEIAIPFKSLRYRSGTAQVWGINIQRTVASINEVSFLTPMPAALAYSGIYKLSSAATLTGLVVPATGRRLEIKPYAIADATTGFLGPQPSPTALGANGGVDVKFGLTQGLTADLTYNTDFAQVEVDEQQVNLTRFGLFFPEKREFFLEGQGIFDFGPGRISGPTTYYFQGERYGSVTPVLFFSRRIGLNGGQTVPIQGGGRITGKTGPYSLGLLNVQTGAEATAGAVPTNFSVVRLKRDILRRSSIGAMFTGRTVTIAQDGANRVYGVDGGFGFYDNVRFNTYLARSESPDRRGDDLSYQAQFDYSGDTWGVLLDRLAVGANFNPELGFLRRQDFRRNYTTFRYSPRPRSIQSIRKFLWEGSLDYTVDGIGLLETRTRQGLFSIDFENGDRFFAGMTDNYEFLKEPFEITPNIAIPVGSYSFVNTRVLYALGNQRNLSGAVTFDRGGFFGGDRTSVGYFSGRAVLSSKLSFEPSLSFNWIDLPQGHFTTGLVAIRSTYTVSPRMFAAALVQFNSSANSLSTNLRFRWEYAPGSELFVVYTDERDTLTPRFPAMENRAFVVKLTRLFRF